MRQAIRCFARQTLRRRELIVIDDGDEPIEDACAGLDCLKYIRLTQPHSTGAKLNIGIEAARGSILQKLDDDDYYHPGFLQTAVNHLPPEDRDRCIVAWDCFLVLLAGEPGVRFSGHGWTVGGTLCFSRKLWERCGFRDIPVGADAWFLRDHGSLDPGLRLIQVCSAEQYVVVRHGGNTWNRMRHGETTDDYLRALPVYSKPIGALVHRQDRPFYRSLMSGKRPRVLA
jgi:glycosyltransferase involved in cell wall biosynthesis